MKFEDNIGKRVTKREIRFNPKKAKETIQKPFKSGLKTNTIKGIVPHPILGIPAYTFEEDDSYVECRRCRVIFEGENLNRQQARDILNNGGRITHRYFMEGEYVEIVGNKMAFENGTIQSVEEFWSLRKDESWDSGWQAI